MDLSNKVAIVTGGAKGIGLASAECMLRQGADVMIVDWSGDAASAAVKTLTALSKASIPSSPTSPNPLTSKRQSRPPSIALAESMF